MLARSYFTKCLFTLAAVLTFAAVFPVLTHAADPGLANILVGSLLGLAVPAIHMMGKGVGGDIAKSSGAFFFVWTLIALGVTALFSVILSACGLWRMQWGKPTAQTWKGPSHGVGVRSGLLIKWRSHAGCGVILSTVCLL